MIRLLGFQLFAVFVAVGFVNMVATVASAMPAFDADASLLVPLQSLLIAGRLLAVSTARG